MAQKVFITGATGYIGTQLAKRLAAEGKTIHLLYRSKGKINGLEHPNIKFFEGDLSDKESLLKGMLGCDEVYHLAAFARVWAKDPKTFYDINVTGTLHLLEAAKETGVGKIVNTSTAGVIGPSMDGHSVAEDEPRLIDFFNEYESSKFVAEEKIQHYVRKGMNIVTVNPTRVYGPGLTTESNPVTKMIHLYMKGKWRIIPGDGTKRGNYVYIDDVVEGHILAMKNGRAGERYTLGGSENISYEEFFKLVAELTNKKITLFRLPMSIMMTFAGIQKLLADLFSITPMILPKWVKKYLYDWSLSINKAELELGYRATPLRTGILNTITWLKANEKR